MYLEHVRDIREAYGKVRSISDAEEKKAAAEKWFSTELPEVCSPISVKCAVAQLITLFFSGSASWRSRSWGELAAMP